MFFIIKKEEFSENLGDFLEDKCLLKIGEQFVFFGECWSEIIDEIGQCVHEFFECKFIYTADALDYLAENYHDPIKAAAEFCAETGYDGQSLNASMVASHFFNSDILNELYNIEPSEKEFLYEKQDIKFINYKKGVFYAPI